MRLAEIFNETCEFARDASATEVDLSELKDSMLPDTINRFETIADIAGQLGYLTSHQLPDRHFALEPRRFAKVEPADVDRLAQVLFAWPLDRLDRGGSCRDRALTPDLAIRQEDSSTRRTG